MSDTACMVIMSSPSSATSVGEPDCDEPPEPPNLDITINQQIKQQQQAGHDGVESLLLSCSMVITPIDTNSSNDHHDHIADINSSISAHIIARRASNSSISSDDDNHSTASNTSHTTTGSISPLSSITSSTLVTCPSSPPLVVIGGHAAHRRVASSPLISLYDTYESKEMKIRYDPRDASSSSSLSTIATIISPIHNGGGGHISTISSVHDCNMETKDTSKPSVSLSSLVTVDDLPMISHVHKNRGGEDEHKEETNNGHSHEFKEVERAIVREEKKVIVMLATAMLDDSHSADKQIAFNLGKLEMVADLSHTLEGLGHCVRSELVSHKNIDEVVNHIKPTELVFNLCDGTDDDGVVGVSLVNKLEDKRLAFTGACSAFYTISSAKSRMKACFEGAHVPTMPYRVVSSDEDASVALADGPMSLSGHLESLKQWPLFVKPDDAYGSMGISDACVCRNHDELMAQCDAMRKSGFKQLMVEGFLDGDEFSVLMTDVQTYPAVKKVYLREGALCLDFKADWIDNSYEMVPVNDQELDDRLRAVAQSAYTSVAGNSYARVDLRIHRSTGIICVLEVNSQPGIGDNSTAWDVLIGYASRAKLSKAHVTAQFLQDIVARPRRGLLPLGITVDGVPHCDPE